MRKSILVLIVIFVAIALYFIISGIFGGSPDEQQPVEPTVEVPSTTVLIDAGHGGREPGAVVGDVLEKDINLAIANKVAQLAKDEPSLDVVLTRVTDIHIDNVERLAKTKEVEAVLYLSIHTNSFEQPTVSGAESRVDDKHSEGDPSWRLADLVLDAVVEATGTRKRSVVSRDTYLQDTDLPAAAIEVGFLTNPEERANLQDSIYQDKIASGIIKGILAFIDEMQLPATEETTQ